MLRPRRMARVLVTGSRDHLARTVEILYDANAVHLIAHDPDEADVPIGDPMERGETLSDWLVQLRSARSALGIPDDARPRRRYPVEEIESEVEARLFDLRTNLNSVQEDRERIEGVLADLDAEIARLEPLAALPLKLDDYHGYRTVECLFGRMDGDPEALLADAGIDAGAFSGRPAPGEAPVHAVFVLAGDADAARETLAGAGWTGLEAPDGEGDVAARLDELRSERERFEGKLDALDRRLDALRDEHADFLVAAEEHLSIEAEKADAPLQFASTDNAFVLEGWVPEDVLDPVERRLEQEAGDEVHVETLEVAVHKHPAHADHPEHAAHAVAPAAAGGAGASSAVGTADGEAEAGAHADHGGRDGHDGHDANDDHGEEATPPTQLGNEGPTKPFEMITNLMSRPRYDEIDPTVLLLIFFPLMFGLMIGDVAYGIGVLALGLYLTKNKLFGVGGPKVGRVLVWCGIATIVIGFVVYLEFLGLHFLYPPAEAGHIAHEMHELHLGGAGETLAYLESHGEFIPPTWAGLIFGADQALAWSQAWSFGFEPLVFPLVKLQSLEILIQISLWLALFHLSLGFVLGFINEKAHIGASEAFRAKFGWLFITWGWFFVIIVGMLGGPLLFGWLPLEGVPTFMGVPPGMNAAAVNLGVPLVAVGAVMLATAEPEGIVELFGVLSNMMSYARLAAIGISKAGFVFVFNVIAFQMMGGSLAAIPLLAAGHGIVFILGLISSGVQSLRLNFYEFFSKFYEGGGHPYRPFGRRRVYTEG